MTEVSSEQSKVGFICIQQGADAAAVVLLLLLCVHAMLLLHCCCYSCVAAAAVLLVPTGIRHRVPDGQISCGFVDSDPSVYFSVKCVCVFFLT